MTTVIQNSSDGMEVAGVFVGLHLNRYYRSFPVLFERLAQENRNFEYNFTILCLSWFMKLAQAAMYDDRNSASVQIARRMAASCKFNGLTYRYLGKCQYMGTQEVDINSGDDMAAMLKRFLYENCNSKTGLEELDAFLSRAVREHRTLQQNFTRFCFEWFRFLADNAGESKASHIKLARLALQYKDALPYI